MKNGGVGRKGMAVDTEQMIPQSRREDKALEDFLASLLGPPLFYRFLVFT